jgi:GT2 family glycosyltransferase
MPNLLSSYDPAVPVSVIVVNWSGRDHLETCFRSVLGQGLPGIEAIMVDNGSTDDSLAYMRKRFGESVRIVMLGENRGYGAALNAGLRIARGHYLFILNNDTELDRGCLETLYAAGERHSDVGSFAPKILFFDDRKRLDNVGHMIYPDGLSRGRGRLEEDRGQYDGNEEILLFSGCAALLRREMLADVGIFDEDLFAYCEDTDLGLRAQLAGWPCRAVPHAVVYHKYSASTAAYSPMKAFLVERNRAWVAVKCLPAPLLIISPLFTIARLVAQALGVLTHRGAAARFAAENSAGALLILLARAAVAALCGLRQAWRKRRAVQKQRRISNRQAFSLLMRYGMGVREIAWKD